MDRHDVELLARLRAILAPPYVERLHEQQAEIVRKAERELAAGKVPDLHLRHTLDEIWLAVGPPSDPDDVEVPTQDKPRGRVLPLGPEDPDDMFEDEDPEDDSHLDEDEDDEDEDEDEVLDRILEGRDEDDDEDDSDDDC